MQEDYVLGLGRQTSVRQITALCSSHVQRIEGGPKTLKMRGPGIKIIAERDDYDSEFTRFTVRGRISTDFAAKLRQSIEETGGHCDLVQDENSHVLTHPASGKPVTPESLAAFDQVAAVLRFPEIWRVKGENFRVDPLSIEMLFRAMVQYKASDLHLSAGFRPFMRKNRTFHDIHQTPLTPELARRLNLALLNPAQRATFLDTKDLDFALAVGPSQRYRVNLMTHKGGIAGSYRIVPGTARTLEQLGYGRHVPTIEKLLSYHNGLILVTGPVGAGKTTTLASLVALLNESREDHIITVEDPIEVVQPAAGCNVTQREVGLHTRSFATALKGALREDPDIIVIGELRDLETVEERLFALRAAARKFQVPVAALPALAAKFAGDLDALDHGEAALARLEKAVQEAQGLLAARAKSVSAKRRNAASALDEAIANELPPLKLERARFLTEIDSEPTRLEASGIDRVAFHVATNPGTPPGPMMKIASGGELARFMLALKVSLADRGSAPTLVFDEIDTGVGGAVADAIGARLARLAGGVQVIAVTHAPQVAARAGHHFRIAKEESGEANRVATRVARLDQTNRREEIARMLSGASISDEARAAAAKLLEA
jgi:predicted ABC-type transport system involved in lysophospholipase L1 biosynthesis ATPase subunit